MCIKQQNHETENEIKQQNIRKTCSILLLPS